jgi:hypothetical protein
VDGVLCHPTRLLIRAKSEQSLQAALRKGAVVVKRIPKINWVVVETAPGKLREVRGMIRQVPGIAHVSLDRAARPAYDPNDPFYPNSWHLSAIKANLAWDLSLGHNAPIVAVIDTGVETNHPDLSPNIWINPGEVPANAVDDDGNGYVDDYYGYDFAYGDAVPDDMHGHGTACAGLAAGVGDNGIGITGVAPRARIMSIKAANDSGYFYDSATVPAYIYAADMGARIFSMSYYADSVSEAEKDALMYALRKGVLPIAAAGNANSVYPFYPAAYEMTMAVAAAATNLNKAGFSNFGSWVDVTAPGVSLYSTRIGGAFTSSFGGTSGATPIVAGLAALMWGANPSARRDNIRFAIENSADIRIQAPFGEISNYGFINAHRAVQAITGTAITPKPPVVRWVSPIGTAPVGSTVIGRVYGRRLLTATVNAGGAPSTMRQRTRDWADYELPTTPGRTVVRVGTSPVATLNPPLQNQPHFAYCYPMIEGSTEGAQVLGGYRETLAADGVPMIVTRRGDGSVYLEATFKNLPRSGAFQLVLQRQYPGSTRPTEHVELYNWAGASFPYGWWTTMSLMGAPPNPHRVTVSIPEIAPFVDYEGTVYLRLSVNDGLPAGADLNLDMAYLRPTS